ncbi:unnamed protein product [Zymoseptoria tritici ST99CH_3D1]|nr:unnamed protein product [Zymoseptoria tritici ST99CH_3D1]
MHSLTVLQTVLAANLALALNLPRQDTAPSQYAVQPLPLDTPWTDKVGTDPWPQYPRPKLARSEWKSLNGIWTYANASSLDAVNSPPFNQTLPNEVLVPFCLESGLSGIEGDYLLYSWYSTKFSVPSNWTGERTLLNFNAVDYEATVFVNGQQVMFHRGGYFAFSVDVTPYLSSSGTNELVVFVHDPTDSGRYVIPVGKQTLGSDHIFYRPCSGIWQSVWIESAPADYITGLDINGGADGTVNVTVSSSQNSTGQVEISILEKGTSNKVASHTGSAGRQFSFKAESVKCWSPDHPNLYDIAIKFGDDQIESYTGFRTITKEAVNDVQRIVLNGEAIFPFGTLDQGFWPDGGYTPPTYEAMIYDIQTLKKIGYNMLRKHIKVESPLYYQAADELGILVMQDMPSLRLSTETLANCSRQRLLPDAAQQQEFQRQLELLVTQLRSHTCIFAWVIYNEGWGQIESYYPEFALTDVVRGLDPTRLVDAVTGFPDHGAGDFSDNHHYANPQCGTPFYSLSSSPFDPSRIGFQGEFGGIGNNVTEEHAWKVQDSIDAVNQTYELDDTIEVWNYRGHTLLTELLSQVEMYSCAGAVWTQTTDVEGEVNGMLTYDRRVLRPDLQQWQTDIQALYDASAKRTNASMPSH